MSTGAVASFVDYILHHALSRPEKPAVILPDRVVTYGMMARGILRVEARLASLALQPGSLVTVSLASPVRQLIVAAALFRLGFPMLPISRPDQALGFGLPIVLFLHDSGFSFIPGQRQLVVDDDWFSGEPQSFAASPPKGFSDEEDIALIGLSSGTTGVPKAISLSLGAFQRFVINYYSSLGLGIWDRLLLMVGLNSAWGLTLAAHCLQAGRSLVLAANPREGLHMIAVYGADAMVATTVQLRELLRQHRQEPLPCGSLRTILTGGGLASQAMLAEARARLCSSIVVLYGSTEAGGTAYAHCDRLTGEGDTGFVAPWAEVEIVDDADRLLPAGADGILRIRSTCLGAPYPPGTDNPSFRDGWFYPGDIGRIRDDGLLVLGGRTSEVINVGGLKLAPETIEDLLSRHSAVVDAAAFGSMGDSGIEEISVALVVSRPVAESHLVAWCAERGVPLTRAYFVDVLPKTDSGKVDRELLKNSLHTKK